MASTSERSATPNVTRVPADVGLDAPDSSPEPPDRSIVTRAAPLITSETADEADDPLAAGVARTSTVWPGERPDRDVGSTAMLTGRRDGLELVGASIEDWISSPGCTATRRVRPTRAPVSRKARARAVEGNPKPSVVRSLELMAEPPARGSAATT
jgi:hypothetical protein